MGLYQVLPLQVKKNDLAINGYSVFSKALEREIVQCHIRTFVENNNNNNCYYYLPRPYLITKRTMERDGDGDTDCYWCTLNNLQRIGKRNERL